jgi:hypothetical protein
VDLEQTEHQYANSLNGFAINSEVLLRSQLQFFLYVDRLLVKNTVLFQCNAAGCVGKVGGWIVVSCFILRVECNTAGCVGNVEGWIVVSCFILRFECYTAGLDVSVM